MLMTQRSLHPVLSCCLCTARGTRFACSVASLCRFRHVAMAGIWRHLGGIWVASGRHLGGIWEASGKHLEASGRHLGCWTVPRRNPPESRGEPPESRRRTGHGLVGDVDNEFRKKASLAR